MIHVDSNAILPICNILSNFSCQMKSENRSVLWERDFVLTNEMKCLNFSAFLVVLFWNYLSVCVIKILKFALSQREALVWIQRNQIIKYIIWNYFKEGFKFNNLKSFQSLWYTRNAELWNSQTNGEIHCFHNSTTE